MSGVDRRIECPDVSVAPARGEDEVYADEITRACLLANAAGRSLTSHTEAPQLVRPSRL